MELHKQAALHVFLILILLFYFNNYCFVLFIHVSFLCWFSCFIFPLSTSVAAGASTWSEKCWSSKVLFFPLVAILRLNWKKIEKKKLCRTDSISAPTLSWKELLLILQHLIWMCSSVCRTWLPMSVRQVDCKNRKCKAPPSIPQHISVMLLIPQPQLSYFCKRNMLPISVLSFLTGAIYWMNSRSTGVHVGGRETQR